MRFASHPPTHTDDQPKHIYTHTFIPQDNTTKPIILSEALVWAAVLAIAAPLGYEVRGVDLDSDGILPGAVAAACEALKAAGE